ncbi:cytochrome P450 [Nemania sp. FL0916]|nr:cytochrome P450 [Nemania sp. FL0916]
MFDPRSLRGFMTPAVNIVAAVITLIISYYVAKSVYYLYFHPLRSFPGPKSWACSYLPWSIKMFAGDILHEQLRLHQKYGNVVRIGPDNLSITDAVIWKEVCSYRKGHEEFAKDASDGTKTRKGVAGILGASTLNHRRFRKQLAPAFSEKAMREQQPAILKHVDLLVEGLRDCCGAGPQNLTKWFNWTTFDIIGRLAFGESFGCLEKRENHPWIEAVFGNIKIGAFMAAFRRLGLTWLLPYLVPKQAVETRVQNEKFTKDRIERRLAFGDDNADFWDNVLKVKNDEERMSVPEMTANASNLVLGGSETSSTLLAGCIYILLLHPSVMEKVMAELHHHFTSSDEINLITVSHLEYMLAVLRETMRLYPPVPLLAPRRTPRGGEIVGGMHIPEGTKVTICPYVVNRLESNFPYPESFIPERFMEDGPFKDGHHFDAFNPFSIGPRNCIGKNLADAEVRLILAKVLWNFKLELDRETGDWFDQKTYILWQKKPLMVYVRDRLHS